MKHHDHKTNCKSISPQKLAANRRNAEPSTSPRTERGTTHSRGSAIKRGDRKIWGKVPVAAALLNSAVPTSGTRPGRLQ